jgi:hypothetical protein
MGINLLGGWDSQLSVGNGGNNTDLYQQLGAGHARFDASSGWGAAFGHPRVPHLVHCCEVLVDVSQVDRRGDELGAIASSCFKQSVDLLEGRSSLSSDVLGDVGTDLAGEMHHPVDLDDGAHPSIALHTFDCHVANLRFREHEVGYGRSFCDGTSYKGKQ